MKPPVREPLQSGTWLRSMAACLCCRRLSNLQVVNGTSRRLGRLTSSRWLLLQVSLLLPGFYFFVSAFDFSFSLLRSALRPTGDLAVAENPGGVQAGSWSLCLGVQKWPFGDHKMAQERGLPLELVCMHFRS